MKLQEAMSHLQALRDDKVYQWNAKNGAGDNQFGVKLGDIRTVARKIKLDPVLAKELWDTENLDARFLSILISSPKKFSAKELDEMIRSVHYAHLADWLISYVIKQHPEKESMRVRWMGDKNPGAARAGWSLTAERISKGSDGVDVEVLLDRIEKEMQDAHELPQWTMNACLAEIGIHHPSLRARALKIGETLGVYRDYPTSKGCVSPFAPIWIDYMVNRAKATSA